MINVGIVGVSGYGGGELARLISVHPSAKLTYICSSTYEGKKIAAALPGFPQKNPLICEVYDEDNAVSRCDVVFLAQETGFAAKNAAALADRGKKVIDLSADLRIKDPNVYSRWYKTDSGPQGLLDRAVYGLPELHREEIREAQIIANPGCYPTSAILALAPVIAHEAVQLDTIIINSMSGVSGAGRSKQSLTYHFPELNESATVYGVAGTHRHTPEIEQALSLLAGRQVIISFTPHLIPVTRGILTTVVVDLAKDLSTTELVNLIAKFYESEPFVNVLPVGSFPATKHTLGSNYVHIGAAVDARTGRATIVSAEDNLVKGAAGQAIQNMNIMFGLHEETGLTQAGLFP